MSKWIPCSERLPPLGAHVLAYLNEDGWEDPRVVATYATMRDYIDNRYIPGWDINTGPHGGCFLYLGGVTHWQPLPEPPQ